MTSDDEGEFLLMLAAAVITQSRQACPDSATAAVMTVADTLIRWVIGQQNITGDQVLAELRYSLDEF